MAEEQPRKRDQEELSSAARQLRAAEPYITAVWKMVGAAVFGVVGGYFLDKWFGTAPWILVGLSTVSIAIGFYAFIRAMLDLGKR
jgi:ATP synthase protein I